MKKLILPIGLAALLIAACGKKEEAAPAAETTPVPGATQPGAPAQAAPAQAAPSTTEQQPATQPAEQPAEQPKQ